MKRVVFIVLASRSHRRWYLSSWWLLLSNPLRPCFCLSGNFLVEKLVCGAKGLSMARILSSRIQPSYYVIVNNNRCSHRDAVAKFKCWNLNTVVRQRTALALRSAVLDTITPPFPSILVPTSSLFLSSLSQVFCWNALRLVGPDDLQFCQANADRPIKSSQNRTQSVFLRLWNAVI